MPENNSFLVFPPAGTYPNNTSPLLTKQDTTSSHQTRGVSIHSFHETVNGTFLSITERIFRILSSEGPIYTITEHESENLQ